MVNSLFCVSHSNASIQCNFMSHFQQEPNRMRREKKVIHSLSIVLNVIFLNEFWKQACGHRTTPNKWCWKASNYSGKKAKLHIYLCILYAPRNIVAPCYPYEARRSSRHHDDRNEFTAYSVTVSCVQYMHFFHRSALRGVENTKSSFCTISMRSVYCILCPGCCCRIFMKWWYTFHLHVSPSFLRIK